MQEIMQLVEAGIASNILLVVGIYQDAQSSATNSFKYVGGDKVVNIYYQRGKVDI